MSTIFQAKAICGKFTYSFFPVPLVWESEGVILKLYHSIAPLFLSPRLVTQSLHNIFLPWKTQFCPVGCHQDLDMIEQMLTRTKEESSQFSLSNLETLETFCDKIFT